MSSEVSETPLPLHGRSLVLTGIYPINSSVSILSGIHTGVCEASTMMCGLSVVANTSEDSSGDVGQFGGRWDELLIKGPFVRWLGPYRPLNHHKLTMNSSLPHIGAHL